MADKDEGGGWSKLLDRLQSPGDWIAAGVGALGGATVSLAVLGSDFGTSIATGAVAGVTAKASGEATLERRRLRKKAGRLRLQLEEYLRSPNVVSNGLHSILRRLNVESLLWEDKLIDNDRFADLLENLVNEYANELVKSSV